MGFSQESQGWKKLHSSQKPLKQERQLSIDVHPTQPRNLHSIHSLKIFSINIIICMMIMIMNFVVTRKAMFTELVFLVTFEVVW